MTTAGVARTRPSRGAGGRRAHGSTATVRQGDRDKAYRPLPAADRRAAFERAVEAYEAGDYFLAHELLEPAWMGTDDLAERSLHQGLIKLAAGCVHAVRGNPRGLAKNLAGARRHLADAREAGRAHAIDVPGLLADIDATLARGDSPGDEAPPPAAAVAPVIRRLPPA